MNCARFFNQVTEAACAGWKFGATIVCGVSIKLEDARFITNLGAERRMHVLVGKGTRECAPWAWEV